MPYDPHKHSRRSIRLKNYDYSQPGRYFITICAQDRRCLFGEVINAEMKTNGLGEIVIQCWNDIPNKYCNVRTDEFIVMPNHFHGIIVIDDDDTLVAAIHELPPATNLGLERPLVSSSFDSASLRSG